MKNYPVVSGVIIGFIGHYKDPVINQSGFHGMSAKDVVAVAHLFLTQNSERTTICKTRMAIRIGSMYDIFTNIWLVLGNM